MREYSESIADIIMKCLEKDKIKYSFEKESGIFSAEFGSTGKIKDIVVKIIPYDTWFNLYSYPGFRFDYDDPNECAQLCEFVCRANYSVKGGSFEIDLNDGEIRHKMFVDFEGLPGPSPEMVENAIGISVALFKKFSAGITGIIFAGMSAKEAFSICDSESLFNG